MIDEDILALRMEAVKFIDLVSSEWLTELDSKSLYEFKSINLVNLVVWL